MYSPSEIKKWNVMVGNRMEALENFFPSLFYDELDTARLNIVSGQPVLDSIKENFLSILYTIDIWIHRKNEHRHMFWMYNDGVVQGLSSTL